MLIHEVIPLEFLTKVPDLAARFSVKYHTTTTQLADLASQARPRLLILDHVSSTSTEGLLKEMMGRYAGRVVVGRDLEVY